ncbi:MAG: AAA family ATPase [Planctomycetaceae bacterium]|nr:AAA family ATPase [Planctomycetaceae bacterium]
MSNEEPITEKAEIFVKSISFNDGTTLDFAKSDIVVFTGANNAGKSQVLREINQKFKGDNNVFKITKQIVLDIAGQIQPIIKERTKLTPDGKYLYEIGNKSVTRSLLEWIILWERKFLSELYVFFINFLNTEKRISSSNSPKSFDTITTNPQHPIQYLYVDDEKEKELSEYFHQAFGINLIVDRGAGNNIPLFVGDKPEIQQGEDRVSKSYRERLTRLPKLQEQGDGIRSFTGILLDTFISNHTVTLIDEPEAFLHPPQSRLLGKMLAKNTPNNRQLFISTHSEDFLKGLLDADNENVKIIRINREGNTNHMNMLKNEDIKQLWKDPILRYSNILSGLFHSKVVICESDTDCRFYQSVMNAIHDGENEISPDILFTHCGGKQRLKTVIVALKSLNVKIVTIADIDILNDKNTFKEITDSLGINWTELESKWNVIDNYVKDQRLQLDTNEVKKEIGQILNSVSINPFPQENINKIKKILKNSTAWSKIKEVGKKFFTGEPYTTFNEIDTICKKNGLFIVPVGELECFYKPNTNHGPKWVNEVLERVDLKNNPELRDAREFIKNIISF